MVDFADGLSDRDTGQRLSRSLKGRETFRRFRNEVYERHPELVSVWQSFVRRGREPAPSTGWWSRDCSKKTSLRHSPTTIQSPTCRDPRHVACLTADPEPVTWQDGVYAPRRS